MTQIDRDKIEQSLEKKGFVLENSNHRYFHHEYDGKRTGSFTYTSHGSHYKTYGNSLLNMMKKQLRLDTLKDTRDLLMCPMDERQYNEKLKEKGFIK